MQAVLLHNEGVSLLEEGKCLEAMNAFRFAIGMMQDFLSQEQSSSTTSKYTTIYDFHSYINENSSSFLVYNEVIRSSESIDLVDVCDGEDDSTSVLPAIRKSCVVLQPISIRCGLDLSSHEYHVSSNIVPYEKAFYIKILYEEGSTKLLCYYDFDFGLLSSVMTYNMAMAVMMMTKYDDINRNIRTKSLSFYKLSLSAILDYIEYSSYSYLASNLTEQNEESDLYNDATPVIVLMAALNNIGYLYSLMSCTKSMDESLFHLRFVVTSHMNTMDSEAFCQFFDAFEFMIFYINCISTYQAASAA
jgi:hypothetical protein